MADPGVRAAIFDRLVGLPALVAELAPYDGRPGVFSGDRVPGEAAFPYVTVQAVAGGNRDAKGVRRPELLWDVGVFTDDPGSAALVEDLAWAIHLAFHRAPLALTAHQCLIADAAPPTLAPTSDEIAGRIVTLRFQLSELP